MIIIYAGIAGFFVIPIPSLCISFASELVFPLDEGSSTGYLFAGSQTFGFVIGAIITVIVEQAESMAYFALALYAFLQLLACIVVLATQEDLRRLKF